MAAGHGWQHLAPEEICIQLLLEALRLKACSALSSDNSTPGISDANKKDAQAGP